MTDWRKSSRSAPNGNCLEVQAVPWRKSSRSVNNGACVEAASGQGVILVRDSKAATSGAVLKFSSSEWWAFLGEVKSGKL